MPSRNTTYIYMYCTKREVRNMEQGVDLKRVSESSKFAQPHRLKTNKGAILCSFSEKAHSMLSL